MEASSVDSRPHPKRRGAPPFGSCSSAISRIRVDIPRVVRGTGDSRRVPGVRRRRHHLIAVPHRLHLCGLRPTQNRASTGARWVRGPSPRKHRIAPPRWFLAVDAGLPVVGVIARRSWLGPSWTWTPGAQRSRDSAPSSASRPAPRRRRRQPLVQPPQIRRRGRSETTHQNLYIAFESFTPRPRHRSPDDCDPVRRRPGAYASPACS